MTKPTIASVRISSLEVLSGPGDAFDTISCVEKGEVLRVLEKHGNWVKVSFSKVSLASGFYFAVFLQDMVA